jgi:hypothetical protein
MAEFTVGERQIKELDEIFQLHLLSDKRRY